MHSLQGIITATPTPFTKQDQVDTQRLAETIAYYLDAGVDGISVGGSQGEFFSLDQSERLQVFECAVEAVDGRVPIYAGTGAVTTRETITLTKAAQSIGADIAMVITPYCVTPDDSELHAHFSSVADATDLPIILYNNPARTGVNISAALYRECAAGGKVLGIKDSSGNLSQTLEYLSAGGAQPAVFAGQDTMALALLLHGGAGAISPAACVFPKLMVHMYRSFLRGNLEEARRTAEALAPLRWAWRLGSFPVVIKEAMSLVDLDPGPPRLPIAPLGSAERDKLKAVVQTIRDVENQLDDVPANV